jgi:hypothetical protein
MSDMNLFDRRGQPINDWRDWTRPKDEGQWRAARSAMELARAWFTSSVPVVPAQVSALLDSHPLTHQAVFDEGWPELKTRLPFPGEGRNHDLVLVGRAQAARLLLAVEGKVDETMGPAVGPYWQKSKRTAGSRAWRRIDALLLATFGADAVAVEEPWNSLPYQMLTALVGTAIEASNRSCSVAALCVQEFITESAKRRLLMRNSADFSAFLAALQVSNAAPGTLYGPFDICIPGSSMTMPVLLGKTVFKWTSRSARP